METPGFPPSARSDSPERPSPAARAGIGRAALVQVGAAAAVLGLTLATGLRAPLLAVALACGVVAALAAWRLGHPRWFLPVHLLFLPALVVALSLDVPSFVPLGLFAALFLIYGRTDRTRVPLYLSSRRIHEALLAMLPIEPPLLVLDLGAGLAGVQIFLASRRPCATLHGVEAALLPFLIGRLRLAVRSRCRAARCQLFLGSLWDVSLTPYDVVYAYLSPVPMPALYEKARREMRPGTRLISNTFAVPGVEPERTVTVDDLHGSTLYVYVMT